MQYKFAVATIVPSDSLELLDAPFPTIMGIVSSQMQTEEVQRVNTFTQRVLGNTLILFTVTLPKLAAWAGTNNWASLPSLCCVNNYYRHWSVTMYSSPPSPHTQCSNVVIVDLDSGEVTNKELETPLPTLPRHAVETFKQRLVICK